MFAVGIWVEVGGGTPLGPTSRGCDHLGHSALASMLMSSARLHPSRSRHSPEVSVKSLARGRACGKVGVTFRQAATY